MNLFSTLPLLSSNTLLLEIRSCCWFNTFGWSGAALARFNSQPPNDSTSSSHERSVDAPKRPSRCKPAPAKNMWTATHLPLQPFAATHLRGPDRGAVKLETARQPVVSTDSAKPAIPSLPPPALIAQPFQPGMRDRRHRRTCISSAIGRIAQTAHLCTPFRNMLPNRATPSTSIRQPKPCCATLFTPGAVRPL